MASAEDETMKSLQSRLRQGVLNHRQNVNYRAKPTVNLRSLKSNLTGQIDKHHNEQSKTAVGQREKKNTQVAPKSSVSQGGNSVFDRLRAKRDALGSRRAEVASAMKETKRTRRAMGGHNVIQVNENNMTKVALQTSNFKVFCRDVRQERTNKILSENKV